MVWPDKEGNDASRKPPREPLKKQIMQMG